VHFAERLRMAAMVTWTRRWPWVLGALWASTTPGSEPRASITSRVISRAERLRLAAGTWTSFCSSLNTRRRCNLAILMNLFRTL
jgi:hypothetical protein